MEKKIIIISLNKEKLSELEFTKPIEDILKEYNIKFETINYRELINEKTRKKIEQYNKNYKLYIILTGTAIQDFDYLEYVEYFKEVLNNKKNILGICSGSHILSLIHGGEIKKGKEIGTKEALILKYDKILDGLNIIEKKIKIWNLHKYYPIKQDKIFDTIIIRKFAQLSKHKKKNVYMALFHPEVHNKKLIKNFINL